MRQENEKAGIHVSLSAIPSTAEGHNRRGRRGDLKHVCCVAWGGEKRMGRVLAGVTQVKEVRK